MFYLINHPPPHNFIQYTNQPFIFNFPVRVPSTSSINFAKTGKQVAYYNRNIVFYKPTNNHRSSLTEKSFNFTLCVITATKVTSFILKLGWD